MLVMASRIEAEDYGLLGRRGGTSRSERGAERRLLGVRQIVQIACNGTAT